MDLCGDWLEEVMGGDARFMYNCMCQAETMMDAAQVEGGNAWDLLEQVLQAFFVGGTFGFEALIKDGVPVPRKVARKPSRKALSQISTNTLVSQRGSFKGKEEEEESDPELDSLTSLTAAEGGFAIERMVTQAPSPDLGMDVYSVVDAMGSALEDVLEAAEAAARRPKPEPVLRGFSLPDPQPVVLTPSRHPGALDQLLGSVSRVDVFCSSIEAGVSMAMSSSLLSPPSSLPTSPTEASTTPPSFRGRSSLGSFGLGLPQTFPNSSPPAPLSLNELAGTSSSSSMPSSSSSSLLSSSLSSSAGLAAPKKPHMSAHDSQILRETQTFDEPEFRSSFFSPTYSGVPSSPVASAPPTSTSFHLSHMMSSPDHHDEDHGDGEDDIAKKLSF